MRIDAFREVHEARNEVRNRESLLVFREIWPRSFTPLPLLPSSSFPLAIALSIGARRAGMLIRSNAQIRSSSSFVRHSLWTHAPRETARAHFIRPHIIYLSSARLYAASRRTILGVKASPPLFTAAPVSTKMPRHPERDTLSRLQ
jgi:hypothetical protein